MTLASLEARQQPLQRPPNEILATFKWSQGCVVGCGTALRHALVMMLLRGLCQLTLCCSSLSPKGRLLLLLQRSKPKKRHRGDGRVQAES